MKSKEQKRREGEERNAEWRSLTPAEQIASLKGRRGQSKRQMKKLGVDVD